MRTIVTTAVQQRTGYCQRIHYIVVGFLSALVSVGDLLSGKVTALRVINVAAAAAHCPIANTICLAQEGEKWGFCGLTVIEDRLLRF